MDLAAKGTLGFLTVVEHPQFGLCGGYLLLNFAGRPVEFHCTTPIKPNRAQEILYGPTLESFLYGEQIGRTLIQQGGQSPLTVFTDREPAGCARLCFDARAWSCLPGGGSRGAIAGAAVRGIGLLASSAAPSPRRRSPRPSVDRL